MKSVNQNFSMSIVVDGKEIPEYLHEGATFIEGRSGSEYVIRIRNNSWKKACCVLSVDGLSVMNGEEASDKSPGYILNPYQSLDLACYKVDSATGAKFVFSSKDKSYTAEIGQGTNNVGVIALKGFFERYAPPVIYPLSTICTGFGQQHHHHHHHHHTKGIMRAASTGGSWGLNDVMQNSAGGSLGMSPTYSANNATATETLSAQSASEMEETKLGTAFGESMTWHTTEVTFDRETYPDTTMLIYYDSRRNLELRGVKLHTPKVPPLPNPFPGNDSGCPTPRGWKR